MSNPIYFAPLRVPMVDIQTGIITREWQTLLQAMFTRIGGTSGQSTDDILQGMVLGVGAANVQADIPQGADQQPPAIADASFDDLLAELRQTRDALGELTKQFQGLQQGTISL